MARWRSAPGPRAPIPQGVPLALPVSGTPFSSSPGPLAGFVRLSRLAGEHRALAELLQTAAAEVAETLGFKTVCVNLHHPHTGVLDVVAIHGGASVRAALEGTSSRWEDWKPLLDPRFDHMGAYLVPDGTVDWTSQIQASYVPELEMTDADDAWRPEDALFVPLRRRDGELIGVVSVDEPVNGRRPSNDELSALAAMAAHVGYAIESSLVAAAADARRLALERLLEVSSRATVQLDPEPALAALCAAAAETLAFAHVELAVPRAGRLVCLACSSPGEGRLEAVPEGALHGDGAPAGALGRASERALTVALADPAGAAVGVLLADEPGDTPLSATEREQLLRTFAGQAQALLLSAAHGALQTSEARKDAMLNASLDGILTFDRSGRILEFNPAAEAIFGRPRRAVVGRELGELLIPAARRQAYRTALHEHLAPGAGSQVLRRRLELTALRADGTEFPCEVAVVPIATRGREGLFTAHVRDISERVAADAALREERDRARHDAVHDALTGLLNRTGIERRLAEVLAVEHPDPLLVLCIDLDDFTGVNETFGPAVGDQVLVQLAAELRRTAGEDTLVARTGSDEFVVARRADAARRDALLAAVRTALAEPVRVAGTTTLQVPATLGLATAPRQADPQELLKRAKSALGRAKATQSGLEEFTPGVDRPGERLAMVGGLRRALAREELELHYQPLYRLGAGRPYGFEALLRWRREDGTLIPPGEFIPAAESSGLIEPVGEWVIHEACRQMGEWRRAGLPVGHVQVNVSPRQLRGGGVPGVIAEALAAHGLTPESLVAEVTETAMFATAAAEAAVAAIDALGVRCALDDFGADYSSLSRLASLPVRAIKIDRAFLRNVPGDPRATRMLTAVVEFSAALGLHTVAEGVETREQLGVLAACRVDALQGFLLGRPEPAPAASARLAEPAGTLPWQTDLASWPAGAARQAPRAARDVA
jgi:diguanylate cyclase (GGDEF)-like protein/PAS domain S-box-containing protein